PAIRLDGRDMELDGEDDPDRCLFKIQIAKENGEKRAPKKTKEAAPSATQTRDTTATSSSSQPGSDEPREAAPWPCDPLTPFSKLSTIHGAHISRLGTLGYNPQPLYLDLVIQFLSSVELHYKSEVNKVASEGKLTFLCRGLLYEMSKHELCTLFGFQTRHEACSLPKFPCAYLLWGKIADSSYSEAGSLTEDEAQRIHCGLPLALRPTYDINLQQSFRYTWEDCLLRCCLKGSLGVFVMLTRSLSMSLLAFFLNTRIFHSGKIYHFTMPDGTILHCKLPQAAITSLTYVENMEFMSPADVLYMPPPPASKRHRGSSSSGPTQTQCEDDTIPDISVDHTPDPSMEYLLPPYTGQFDSGAPPFDSTQQQQFAWTADTLVKLSTMMQAMWGALEKIRCPPPPSCCRIPQTSEAAGMTGDIPDVVGPLDTNATDADDAGDEPSDEADDAERGSRLHRSRRAPGQSRSCSPDDHQ
ncbi:LOW QUALITY PROTEIN: hypothetical protein HID58_041768, partial [Brassica napus]